jgi:hypothetical protein
MGATGGGLNNTASGSYATVGGGQDNTASAYHATVGGGHGNTASGMYATVGGGVDNVASGHQSTIGGGYVNDAIGIFATVGGGYNNTASGNSATVGGGWLNDAQADYATIAGGGPSDPISDPTTTNNVVTDSYGTISGGGGNQAGDDAGTTTDAWYATIGGGRDNTASGTYAPVGGGSINVASGDDATVGGGYSNTAGGWGAMVLGGLMNSAGGDASFAAGYRATVSAAHDGVFLWADRTLGLDFDSAAANEFAARATGGVRFVTAVDGSGNPTAGLGLAAGGSTWGAPSARRLKENLAPVNVREVLDKVAAMPIETWNYKTQDESFRHIGPMAEDFRAAFDVGDFKDRISSIDADGVAFAAIQGLYEVVQEKDARIEALQKKLETLEARLDTLMEN